MNAKELEYLYFLIEQFSAEFYRLGQKDAGEGKYLKGKDFKLSLSRRLEIKTFLIKQQKRR